MAGMPDDVALGVPVDEIAAVTTPGIFAGAVDPNTFDYAHVEK